MPGWCGGCAMDGRQASPLKRVRSAQEPAALMSRPTGPGKDRGWERQHRAIAYRIPVGLNEAIKAAVAEYEGDGWITNCSLVAAAWLEAGRRAWEQGVVEVDGRPAGKTGKRGRGL